MYYTVQEVANLLRLSRRSVYRMIDSGGLGATKVGRGWRISDEALRSFLGEAPAPASKPPAPAGEAGTQRRESGEPPMLQREPSGPGGESYASPEPAPETEAPAGQNNTAAESGATHQATGASQATRGVRAPRPERPQLGGFMTAEEFVSLPEECAPANLVQGLFVRDPTPTVSHQELVGRLHLVLHAAIREEGLGIVYLSPMDVILDRDTVLQPDLLAISNGRRHIIGERIQGAPDLVVEVASPSTEERDLTTKRLLYARYGVEECWFVSGRERRLIQVWEPQADYYRQRTIHEAADKVTSARFPSLVVNLDNLFEEY